MVKLAMEGLLLLGRLWLVVESSRSCCRINCDCKARVIGTCWKSQQQQTMELAAAALYACWDFLDQTCSRLQEGLQPLGVSVTRHASTGCTGPAQLNSRLTAISEFVISPFAPRACQTLKQSDDDSLADSIDCFSVPAADTTNSERAITIGKTNVNIMHVKHNSVTDLGCGFASDRVQL